MADISVEGTVHTIDMDASLDRIVRSNDPSLQKMVEKRIRTVLQGPGTRFSYSLTGADFTRLAHLYGEQYVADPKADLDQFFDIVNRRWFSRSIPTQMAVLHLFGTGNQYRPNTGALSAAGEAIAGFCMEKFGYFPLVRPLGIMPDVLLRTERAGELHLALTEAKASTRQDPKSLLEKCVAQFLVDVKTRAQGFSFHYEGYLVTVKFCDRGKVLCNCLRVDLARYAKRSSEPQRKAAVYSQVASYADPGERLRDLIRLQADTVDAQDEYLTSLLSEEATRSSMLDLMRQGSIHETSASLAQDQIEKHIVDVASSLGMAKEWESGQNLIRDTKSREKDQVERALLKYQKPILELD
jgi:hypothetical protein